MANSCKTPIPRRWITTLLLRPQEPAHGIERTCGASTNDALRLPVRPQRRPLRSGPSPPTARDPSPPRSDYPGFAVRGQRPPRAPVAVRSRAAAWSGPVKDPPKNQRIQPGDYAIYSYNGSTATKLLDLKPYGKK